MSFEINRELSDMQKKQKILILSAALAIILAVGVVVTVWFLTKKDTCPHDYTDFTLDGKPSYTVSVNASRTCRTCGFEEVLTVYAAKGLKYETDEDGITTLVGKGDFSEKVLYLADKTEDGRRIDAIASSVFSETKPAAVWIEEGIHTLGEYAFAFCPELTYISLPASLTTFGDYTVAGCPKLRSVHFADGYRKLGTNQFYECTSLTEITLPGDITEIPYGTFFGCCELESITLPDSLTAIGGNAFTGCVKLKGITLPESLKEIYPSAFAGCSSLTTLILPALTTLSHHSFLGCTGLRAVYLPQALQTIEVTGADGPFFSCHEELVLYTDASERPEGWDKHFNSFDSAVSDEDGGELDEEAYFNLKVVYNCPMDEFPGK